MSRRLEVGFKRIIAMVADTHVGSRYSLFPDNYVAEDGSQLSAQRNKGMLTLLSYWYDFIDICNTWGVDTVILNGDMIHGTHRKEFGRDMLTTNLDEQKEACVDLLKPLCKDRIIHTFTGSPYHDSLDSRRHRDLARDLNGVAKKSVYHGHLANIRLQGQEGLADTERILNVAHGVSGASIYRTMVMDREGLFEAAAYGLGDLDFLPDVIVRAHWHTFIHIHLPKQHLIQLPCWAAWWPWKGSIVLYGKKQPHVGGVILFIDEADRIIVHHYLYKPPRIHDYLKDG